MHHAGSIVSHFPLGSDLPTCPRGGNSNGRNRLLTDNATLIPLLSLVDYCTCDGGGGELTSCKSFSLSFIETRQPNPPRQSVPFWDICLALKINQSMA